MRDCCYDYSSFPIAARYDKVFIVGPTGRKLMLSRNEEKKNLTALPVLLVEKLLLLVCVDWNTARSVEWDVLVNDQDVFLSQLYLLCHEC